ncbi:glycine-rich cell wall structural protein 1-like [Schistocerca americana]|uniref:glycine-rich cell wall structural protein 1-like n=1 Tax=Schistocerca americana TaxID=7009 RepID=UPI001F4FA663|nr:glycine-rich cell wall structural protein 1-like [Schistocerca americana]
MSRKKKKNGNRDTVQGGRRAGGQISKFINIDYAAEKGARWAIAGSGGGRGSGSGGNGRRPGGPAAAIDPPAGRLGGAAPLTPARCGWRGGGSGAREAGVAGAAGAAKPISGGAGAASPNPAGGGAPAEQTARAHYLAVFFRWPRRRRCLGRQPEWERLVDPG